MGETINLLKLMSIGEQDIKNSLYCSTEELDKKVAALLEARETNGSSSSIRAKQPRRLRC
jgi:hypothetical protein